MKYIVLFVLILFVTNCSKPKTVLICGDHICINKAEAKQYFEDNLTLEVKVIDNKVEREVDLVELNLKNNKGKKEISILPKSETNKNLKTLSNDQIDKIKKNLKNKKKQKRVVKKIVETEKKIEKENKVKPINKEIIKSDVNKKNKEVVDVCTIIEKCSIEEISKYLLEQGRKKDFPDITERQ